MNQNIFLSVVIPCYNEQENIERGVLDEVSTNLDKLKINYEVIVSDDESTDQSLNLLKKFKHPKFRVLKNPHGGKAFALRAGLNDAKGQYVLFTDMDQSTPISELSNLLIKVKENDAKVVIGSRGKKRSNFNLMRKLASQSFSLFRRSFLLKEIVDTQCGFKLFEIELAKNIFSKMMIFNLDQKAQGWVVAAWDVEFLFLAQKMGNKIYEVPVQWQDEDQSTQKARTTSKFIRESLDMLKQIFRVRINDWKGRYEK